MLYAVGGGDLNSAVVSCDCFAHRFENAADQPHREPAYGTDLTDTEWREICPLLPVPGWLEGHVPSRGVADQLVLSGRAWVLSG